MAALKTFCDGGTRHLLGAVSDGSPGKVRASHGKIKEQGSCQVPQKHFGDAPRKLLNSVSHVFSWSPLALLHSRVI